MKTLIEMARESDFTPELLKELFQYDNGVLLWKTKLNKRIRLQSIAGSKDGHGYVQIMINGKRYKAHRLIYIMFHGSVPEVIDHINGVRDDNRIENIRPASLNDNAQNAKKPERNTTGFKNVYWYRRKGLWQVAITVDGKPLHIGYYDNINEANKAAIAARNKYHGEFANHG